MSKQFRDDVNEILKHCSTEELLKIRDAINKIFKDVWKSIPKPKSK
jgi:hypothetical protein